jgi:hypothetical protein
VNPCVVGLAIVVLATSVAVGQTVADDSVTTLRYVDGRLSLHAHQVALSLVLQRIAARTCLSFELTDEAGASPGSWDFSDLPVEDALLELTRPYNIALSRDGVSPTASCVHLKVLPPTAYASSQQTDPLGPQAAASEVPRLVAVIRGEGDLDGRRLAIADLASLPASDALRGLESCLAVRESELRAQVVEALGGIAGGAAPTALGQVVIGDKDAEVRRSAVQALARIDGEAARLFIERALSDQDERVREAASRALSATGSR